MIVGDYNTTQYIRDYKNPIGESLKTNQYSIMEWYRDFERCSLVIFKKEHQQHAEDWNLHGEKLQTQSKLSLTFSTKIDRRFVRKILESSVYPLVNCYITIGKPRGKSWQIMVNVNYKNGHFQWPLECHWSWSFHPLRCEHIEEAWPFGTEATGPSTGLLASDWDDPPFLRLGLQQTMHKLEKYQSYPTYRIFSGKNHYKDWSSNCGIVSQDRLRRAIHDLGFLGNHQLRRLWPVIRLTVFMCFHHI